MTRRQSAEERRDAVLQAALSEFATGGLRGASADAIAQSAGISQPYLFRLFGTKKHLFLACVHRGFRQTLELFQQAAVGQGPDEIFEAMGNAYMEMLEGDRTALLLQLQAYAACYDDEVREVVREGFSELWTYVARVSGKDEDEVRRFFAVGMLLNVSAAMELPQKGLRPCE